MRLPPDTLAGIVDGRIDLAFRRWEKPRVKAGGRQRTAIGVVGFEAVDAVPRSAVTARRAPAGSATRSELLGFLDRRDRRPDLPYPAPGDRAGPRRAARPVSTPDAAALPSIERRLARLDRASPHGPWTTGRAARHRGQPERRAVGLAAEFGRPRLPFKVDVRKLKELGLTESLADRLSAVTSGAQRSWRTSREPEVSGRATSAGARRRPVTRRRRPAGR